IEASASVSRRRDLAIEGGSSMLGSRSLAGALHGGPSRRMDKRQGGGIMRESLRLVVLSGLSALTPSACGGAPEDGIDLGQFGPGLRPLEIDSGNRYTVQAGATVLGVVEAALDGSGVKKVYYSLSSTLPPGTNTLTLTAVADSNIPSPYTFSTG